MGHCVRYRTDWIARGRNDAGVDAFIRASLRGPAAVLAAGLAIAHAGAQEAAPFATVSGFGTLGLAHSSLDQADFTGNPSKPRGAGHSEALSFEVDSLLAAQLTLRPGQRLSVVLQVIAEQNYDGTYRPHVEWANIRYRFTPELDLRLGRTVLPVLLVTESRKVGYGNPWVRPPAEVYGLVPFTNSDGLDASLRLPVGLATNTLQASAGRSNPGFPAGASGTTIARVRGAVSLADTVEYGFAAARLSLGRARLTIPAVNTLFDSFRELGPAGAALADRYDVHDSLATFRPPPGPRGRARLGGRPVVALTRHQVVDIFLGKAARFPAASGRRSSTRPSARPRTRYFAPAWRSTRR